MSKNYNEILFFFFFKFQEKYLRADKLLVKLYCILLYKHTSYKYFFKAY
jgi:hypothetical protein